MNNGMADCELIEMFKRCREGALATGGRDDNNSSPASGENASRWIEVDGQHFKVR